MSTDSNQATPIHYVSTWQEAEEIIAQQSTFWLGLCGCREDKGTCSRSGHDVCLMFSVGENPPETTKQVDEARIRELMSIVREQLLVPRPFLDSKTRTENDGICFCCDDCCGYFLNEDEVCSKGKMIEETDFSQCIHCGECVPSCYFEAREMKDGELRVDKDKCYGCGICAAVCPIHCIEMVARKA